MSPDLISLLALVVALTSTVISYLLLKTQNDPEILVYAVADHQRQTIINLIIENTGNGIAREVSFESNISIPERAYGFEDAKTPALMTEGPLVTGISFFASGEKRVITWGQYGGLKKGLGDEILKIKATYYSAPMLSFKRRKHVFESQIDLRSFEGTDASDQNWNKKIVDELKNINKSLNAISRK